MHSFHFHKIKSWVNSRSIYYGDTTHRTCRVYKVLEISPLDAKHGSLKTLSLQKKSILVGHRNGGRFAGSLLCYGCDWMVTSLGLQMGVSPMQGETSSWLYGLPHYWRDPPIHESKPVYRHAKLPPPTAEEVSI